MLWREAVIAALKTYSEKHQTRLIQRQKFIEEELPNILVKLKVDGGKTPSQTLSRIMQELRSDEVVTFLGSGHYLLGNRPFSILSKDMSEDVLNAGIKQGKLIFEDVQVDNVILMTRQRRGQQRLRYLTLQSYQNRCALCDIRDKKLLIASHIVRWQDDVASRGILSNVICFCRFHDALFEYGYLSLQDDYTVLKKASDSMLIQQLFLQTAQFSPPTENQPAPLFLKQHRQRNGFE